MSTAIFLPTRKGSQRVVNKNTRKFASFKGGLLELKLNQLKDTNVDEVILSTNDPDSIKIAESIKSDFSNLKIDHRPDNLASSYTDLSDLIRYSASLTSCENILWTHVTSPFVNHKLYEKSLSEYHSALKNGYDSLMSVSVFKNFLWSKEDRDIINRAGEKRWPQTQDLKTLYEINSAIFIAPKKIYEEKGDRVGDNPFLMELEKIESLDIDWEEDFKIAEAVYDKICR